MLNNKGTIQNITMQLQEESIKNKFKNQQSLSERDIEDNLILKENIITYN